MKQFVSEYKNQLKLNRSIDAEINKTSVNVNKSNHKEFKILCIRENITFQRLVNIALDKYVNDIQTRAIKYPDEMANKTDEFLEAHGVIREKIKKKNGGLIENLQKRKAMREGGEIRQQYGFGDRVQGAMSRAFIGASVEDMKKLQSDTMKFVDDAADRGEIEEHERTKYPKGKPAQTGEAYNAIVHGRLAVRYGNKYPQSRLGLQGKEVLQSKGIMKGGIYDETKYGKENNWWTEPSDALNNDAAFNILDKNPNITPEEADKLLIKLYQTSRQKTKNGEPLIVGQDLFLTKEDYIKAGKPKINLFGN